MSNYAPNHSHNHQYNNPNYPPNQPPFYYGAPPGPFSPRGRGAPYGYGPTSPHYPTPYAPQPTTYHPPQPTYYSNPYKPSAGPPSPSPVITPSVTTPKKTIQITNPDGSVPEFFAKKVETNINVSGAAQTSLSSAPSSAAGSVASSPLNSSASSPLASPISINVTKKDGGEVKFDQNFNNDNMKVDFKDMAKEILKDETNDEKNEVEKENKEVKSNEEVNKEINNNVEVDNKKEVKEEKKSEEVAQVKEEKIETKGEEIKEEKTNEQQTNDNTTTEIEEEDSWENRGEDDLADLQDNRDDMENFDPNRIWRPDFEDGERVYSLDFLTKFQGLCRDKPEGMASFDINVDYRGGGGGSDWRGGGGGGRGYGGSQGSGGGGRGGRGGNPSKNSPKSPHRGGGGGYRDRDNNYGKKRERMPADNRENPLMKKSRDLSKVELVLKSAKGLLNKLTFEKFNSLSEKIVNVGIDEETLEPIIKLVFEKAVSEPKYSMMYTKLCKILSVKYPTYQRNGETISFRRILLNKCQEEFENKKIIDAENLSKEEIDELDFKMRNRMKGNITFIGELFKEKMLNDQIIHYCINHLLGDISNPDSANIEVLCRFFATTGKMMDSEKNKEKIDKYFEKLKFIKDKSNLSTRIKFAIDDVTDLRRSRWIPRRADEAPDTIKAVHKSMTESKQSSTPPSSPHRKDQKGRNNSNSNLNNSKEYRKVEHNSSNSSLYNNRDNNNNNNYNNNNNNSRDNNRDNNKDNNNNISNSNFGAKKLQPEKKNQFNQFAALSQASPPPSPLVSSPRRELTPKEMKNLLETNINEFLSGQIPFDIEDYRDIKTEDLSVVLEIFLYLIKKNLGAAKISPLFEVLLSTSYITPEYFVDGLNKVIENYEDYAEDIPNLSTRIASILTHLITKEIIPFSQFADLDSQQLIIPFLLRREIRNDFADLLSNFHAKLAEESVKKEAFQFLTLLSNSEDDEFNKNLLSKVNLSEKENDFLSEVSSLLKSSFSGVGVERVKKVITELKLINEQKLNEQLN